MRRTLLLALTALWALSCGGDTQRAARLPAGTPVVLISVDTLRSDRLPAYGYRAVETPAIDALRRDAILFTRAYSHVPLTLPSHASLLTGLLPPDHAVRDNMGYHLHSEELPYLPRLLGEVGYATGAAVSAFVLRGATGLADGWDFYDDQIEILDQAALGRLQRPGAETLERTLPWLRSVSGEPFFLFFHIYEPHAPYEPPEPFATRYSDRYDGEVAAADAVVGRLLAELRRLGLYDPSLVVLVSDHGEGLGDHGQAEHEVFIYREVLQVPLLVKLPGGTRAGDTVERPVELVDVVPTVLELLGLARPAGLAGSSLLAESGAGEAPYIYSESLYPRLHYGWSELRSLISNRWHYIHGPDPELYDLLADPAESRNLLREQRRTYGELKQELERFDLRLEAPGEVDPETRQRLAALGYVGSLGLRGDGPLPDPKARLQVLEPLGVAFRAFYNGDYATAADGFERVLEREPQLVDAWEHLGKARQRLGQPEKALTAFTKAIELSAGAPQIALSTAELLVEMDRLEEARKYAELASTAHEVAWDLLTEIALRQEQLSAAEESLAKALALRGTRLGPLVLATRLYLEQGRYDEALAATRQAEAEAGSEQRWQLRGLYFAWGRAKAEEAEIGEAAEFFRREIELNPDSLGPYTHLAFLYALQDDGRRAGTVLRQMVEANPDPEAYAAAVETLRAMGDPRSADTLLRQAQDRWPDSHRLRDLQG